MIEVAEFEALEDRVLAMEFAFKCLAIALDEEGKLPIQLLQGHLLHASRQMRDTPVAAGSAMDMSPVAGLIDALRVELGQLRPVR